VTQLQRSVSLLKKIRGRVAVLKLEMRQKPKETALLEAAKTFMKYSAMGSLDFAAQFGDEVDPKEMLESAGKALARAIEAYEDKYTASLLNEIDDFLECYRVSLDG